MEQFKDHIVYQEIKANFPEVEEIQIFKMMAAICLLISVAVQDKKLTREEVSYLKRYSRYFLKIDKTRCDHIVKFIALSYRDDQELRNSLGHFIEFINHSFSKEECRELLGSLLVISRSDCDMSLIEKDYTAQLAKKLGLSSKIYQEELVAQSLILSQKIFDEVKKSNDIKLSDKEFDQFQILSAREYFVSHHNPTTQNKKKP